MNYPKNRYSGDSPWMNKDWLYNQYVILDKRTIEIANEFGCKQNTIQCWLRKHGISKPITKHVRNKTKQYETYDYLYTEHIVNNKSIQEIALENNVSYDTIKYHLIANKIAIQKRNRHYVYSDSDVDVMVLMYNEENMSANQIANWFGTSGIVIRRHLTKRGIQLRSMSNSQFVANDKAVPPELFDADLLYKLHWINNISCKSIGNMIGVDAGTVRRQMHRLGLSTKTNAESKIGLMKGSNHPNWQGGRTLLKKLLREFFTTNQAPAIAKRDNYTCQLCGATHTVLHVHHIVEFSKIVNTICDEHPELDPNDQFDKQQLYDIITHDSRFLDQDNLITFCSKCHFFLIHNYNCKTISSQAPDGEGSETIS